ncbi:MAG: hypothetical protein JSS66_07260 [Armatimonadetes bacterium]|nr:hypothetical protein [Armatimonadota bacterium]
MSFVLHEYDPYDGDRLGVFFYGETVRYGWEKDLGFRSYEFKLMLAKPLWGYDQAIRQEGGELLRFVYSMNLKDLPREKIAVFGGKKIVKVLWEQLLLDADPKQYKHCLQRLRRRLSTKPVPARIEYKAGDWHKGDEFLVFTKDTSHNWGGPFEQGGKQGCCANVTERPFREFPVGNIAENWHYYQLPRHLRDTTTEKWVYHASPAERRAKFIGFSMDDQFLIAKNYLKWQTDHSLAECLPWRLCLCGNDDTSYSKYFADRSAVEAELAYLRKMQPLDFERDIVQRDYYFTN